PDRRSNALHPRQISARTVAKEDFVTRPRPFAGARNRFNWRLWFVLGTLTELFLIYVARWWAPSPATYFLAVLFLPVMVLTGFWANASTLIGRVFVTQQPVIVEDCLHDIEAGQLLPQTFGYRDLLLVPLGSGGRPVGVLMLANKRNGTFSGNYDVKLAASLGAEVAVSLDNTFLFEQTRQQALRLDTSMEMLRQVSQALTATTV